jgi:hypothetical protein
MRQSLKRTGSVVAAVLLTLAGMISVAGTASAAKQPNSLRQKTHVQGCAFPSGCAQDVLDVAAGTAVSTYCVSDIYNVIYTGPSTGRGGFVNRSLLTNPTGQTQGCDVAGVGAVVVASRADLRACNSSNCVDFGDARLNNTAGVFCQLGDWYLVYVDQTGSSGFLPRSALSGVNVPAC